jgi:hypothetical protein
VDNDALIILDDCTFMYAARAGDAEARVPVEHPGALMPQSWAAAAPLLTLRTPLGMEPGGRSDPHIPERLGKVRLV